ncbi:MAG: glycosyltransferase family 4 protein [Chitinophagaceae bacterium]
MNIGFDAKRAFHNSTGLGNYSRTLISALAEFYPEHQYFLFNPRKSSKHPKPAFSNVHEVLPQKNLAKFFSSLWRGNWVKNDLKRINIQLYHGLSHEIPFKLSEANIPSVVTIHDLIFERFPHHFKKIDVQIYRKKFQYACKFADKIIAISKQTKDDIVNIYGIPLNKIDVCYQSCDPSFTQLKSNEVKESVRIKYKLPQEFFLYVGSIIQRKNLLNICKAMLLLQKKKEVPLVVIGDGKQYKARVKSFIEQNDLSNQIIFLSENTEVKNDLASTVTNNLPAIYQMASAMIYPSFFEGFGLPVLEALCSRIPVVTSNVSCLPETGGDAALYVDPQSPVEIANAMFEVYSNSDLRNEMIQKGLKHAQNFTLQKSAESVINVYKKIV